MRHMDSEPACRHYVWNLGLDYWNPPDEREEPAVYEERLANARTVCDSCPLQEACRRAANDLGEQLGIWGGVDMEPRRKYGMDYEESKRLTFQMGQEGNGVTVRK